MLTSNLIREFTNYNIEFVKYKQEYWIINRQLDVLEAECKSLPEALATAEALDGSLRSFVVEEG